MLYAQDTTSGIKPAVMQPATGPPGGGYSCRVTSTPGVAYVGDTITVLGLCTPMPSLIAWNNSCGIIYANNSQQTSMSIIITSNCYPSLTLSTYGPTGPAGPSVTITIYNQLNPGSFSPTSLTINYNTSPGQLPISAATGGKGSYTYQWQSSSDNINWNNISGATTVNYTPGNLTNSVIYYRRIVTSVEKIAYSNVLTVHVNPPVISGSTPSLDQNYILSRDVLKGGVNTQALINSLAATEVKAQIAYFDGLGRSSQNIAIQASPAGTDIIIPVGYDSLGRQDKSYLPYPASGTTGSFRTNALNPGAYTSSDQYTFYQSHPDSSISVIPTNPFNQTAFEASPLNRAIEQGFAGQTWAVGSGHTITSQYFANTALDSVKIWNVTISTTPGSFSTYTMAGNYAAGQLYKTIIKDENGKQVIEFKDKEGRVILKKVQLTASDTGTGSGYGGWLATFYIYDDIGNLRAVIQPNGVAALDGSGWSLTSTILAEQCFRYEYDGRNHLYMKQIPGAAAVYTVFNNDDRPVMTQEEICALPIIG